MKWKQLIYIEDGFTLLEIMITLVILSLALVALAGLQISAIRGNAFSKRMTTAVSIGEARLEQLKNTSYANIQSESPTQVTESNMNFTRQVTITNNSPLPNTRTVNITVTWKQGSKSYTVPISTIITQ
jgi:type IV pilus assembly protein PilV